MSIYKIISALIIDDEPLDRKLMCNLLRDYCPSIEVKGEASDADTAEILINALKPDVIFLDIHMPTVNGLRLLDRFSERNFRVVFTTGDDNYGIQAIKKNAFDYLLKPIDVDELIETEQKLKIVINKTSISQQHLKIYHKGEHILINTRDIICLMSNGSYVQLSLVDRGDFIIPRNIKQVLQDLPIQHFKRIHRSFVVNIHHVLSYRKVSNDWFVTLTGGKEAKVSRQCKSIIKDLGA